MSRSDQGKPRRHPATRTIRGFSLVESVACILIVAVMFEITVVPGGEVIQHPQSAILESVH